MQRITEVKKIKPFQYLTTKRGNARTRRHSKNRKDLKSKDRLKKLISNISNRGASFGQSPVLFQSFGYFVLG